MSGNEEQDTEVYVIRAPSWAGTAAGDLLTGETPGPPKGCHTLDPGASGLRAWVNPSLQTGESGLSRQPPPSSFST